MDIQNWREFKRIVFRSILETLPTFFPIYISLYQNVIYTAGKSFSVIVWP